MATVRHLRNAPISEAIVDFRVAAREGFDASEFEGLRERLADELPVVEDRTERRIVLYQAPAQPAMQQARGILFRSRTGIDISQFRDDGFTLNRLKPYDRWECRWELADRLWKLYVSIARPKLVTRLALRYINRLRVPNGMTVEQCLAGPLPRPPDLDRLQLRGMATRLTLLDRDNRNHVHVTQSLAPEREYILDIDAYNEEARAADDPAIPEVFSTLRNLKNDAFFGSLTDAALKEYE